MLLTHIIAAIASAPLISSQPATAASVPPALSPEPAALTVAQNSDPYADWLYLYEDAFENNAGQEITQRWWLAPATRRENGLVNFTLLARRSPASDNGTAAAVFDYVANCEDMMYAIERTEFLDANDQTLDVQTYQRAMQTADPEEDFYTVLDNLCGGVY